MDPGSWGRPNFMKISPSCGMPACFRVPEFGKSLELATRPPRVAKHCGQGKAAERIKGVLLGVRFGGVRNGSAIK